MAHTFDATRAERLEDVERYRFLSRDELAALIDVNISQVIMDLGSGTGFYTSDIAPNVDTIYGVDLQPVMHGLFRDKGVPENVVLVNADVNALPFKPACVDAAYGTMTFHEFAGTGALSEIQRLLKPGGRLVVADWTANGTGEDGPPLDDRFDLDTASELVEESGFTVAQSSERLETFTFVALPSST